MPPAAHLRIAALDPRDPHTAKRLHAVHAPAQAQEAALLHLCGENTARRNSADFQAGAESWLGAWLDDELVGAIACLPDPDADAAGDDGGAGALQITTLVVHPAWQRRGIARHLLQAVIAHVAGRADGHALTVATGTQNHPALALYGASGFVAYRWGTLGPQALPLVKLRRPAGPAAAAAASDV